MNKKQMRKLFLKAHKILGLTIGFIIIIISLTGAIWVFKDEIESTYSDYKKVTPLQKAMITASEAKIIAQRQVPNHEIHGAVFGEPNEAVEVIFYEQKPLFYQSLYLNPYNGKILKKIDHTKTFFGFILDGHVNLWLPDKIGSRVVSYSVFAFLFILISGIVIWWPKKKKNTKQRLTFDWKNTTRWKRKNFDLHAILGFYGSLFAWLITFTGCIMAFNWFYYITYKSLGGHNDARFIIPKNISHKSDKDSLTVKYDALVPQLRKKYPEAKSFEIHYPENDSSSVYIEVSNNSSIHYNADYLFFDQYTLEEIETPSIYGKYKDASFADKIIRMNYDIHVGSIGGIVGKIIVFISSLIIASLPITGFLIWLGRKRKKS